MRELETIFDVKHEEIIEIVLDWIQKYSIIINNETVEKLEKGEEIEIRGNIYSLPKN